MAAPRPPIDGGTVLITGTSSGIGLELARELAPRARSLVVVARRVERLEALKDELSARYPGLVVRTEACDLSDPEAVDGLTGRLLGDFGAVDVLVNNAGAGLQGLYEKSDWDRVYGLIRLNVVASSLLTRWLTPAMVARGRGGVLNINSGAGVAIMPGMAAYVGTKHFVTGFTETLRAELEGTGVVVSQALPGPVETGFDEAANIGPPGVMDRIFRISAARCAREAIRGFECGRPMIFPGSAYGAVMTLQGALPRALQRRAARSQARGLRKASAR
ncbi:MAG: SDR family oxidoreductase [Rubrobacteraceae bacterium]|nr:SDR family oxidoreductase [Rubrobacteraceae bacterium]